MSKYTKICLLLTLFLFIYCHVPPSREIQDKDFTDFINKESFSQVTAKIEPALSLIDSSQAVQFQRLGYFVLDTESTKENLVFNKTVGLRDTWAKKTK